MTPRTARLRLFFCARGCSCQTHEANLQLIQSRSQQPANPATYLASVSRCETHRYATLIATIAEIGFANSLVWVFGLRLPIIPEKPESSPAMVSGVLPVVSKETAGTRPQFSGRSLGW